MAYNLIFSRSLQSDVAVRFLDIPLTAPSIMIDILSLRSSVRRTAGWIYPIVSDGVADYERQPGTLLVYGKTRLNNMPTTVPYFLELFPKWGTKTGIISVYSGFPSPPVPPSTWKQLTQYGMELRMAISGPGIDFRQPISTGPIARKAVNAIAAFAWGGFLLWKNADNTYGYCSFGDFANELPSSQAVYDRRRAETDAVILA